MSSELDPQLAELQLALVNGVGPRTRTALLERFGDPVSVLEAPLSDLRETPGVGQKVGRELVAARACEEAAAERSYCAETGVRILLPSDPAFPPGLTEIPDPPGVLFVRGELRPADRLAISIVGTRHATHYGLEQAERLAGGLARAGYAVISGLARGVDGAAHRGALKAGGRTFAITGSGCANIYPPEHGELAENITQAGAVISETPPRTPPMSGCFPRRNRIITGMSLGVIVVEASVRSGALISARHAMEQNRDVFAVPGRVDSRTSHGCHRLIRDGAKLVESIDDVLEELGPLPQPTAAADGSEIRHPAELQLNELERTVLAAVKSEPTSIDEMAANSQVPIPQLLSTISVLEMRRLIRRIGGNRVQLAIRS